MTDDRIKSATLLIKLLLERQKIELRAMEAGILRPNPGDDEPAEPARTKKPARRGDAAGGDDRPGAAGTQ